MEPAKGPPLEDLETIYREHHRRVRWVLRGRGVRADALEDLVQETFLAVHRRLGTRDPELSMASFVSGIARNVAFSHRRSRGRRLRAWRRIPEPEPAPGPDDAVEERRAWEALERFLEELDPAQREVFVMTEILGMRMPEVGSVIDAPRNTLYSRLKLARRRFRQHFGDAPEPLRRGVRGERPTARQRRTTWALIVGRLPAPGAPGGALTSASASGGVGMSTWVAVAVVVVGIAGWSTALERPGPPKWVTRAEVTDVADDLAVAGEPPAATAPSVASPPAPPTAPPPEVTADPVPSRPVNRRARAAAAPPTSSRDSDSIAIEVEALRRAKVHLREGRPEAALAVLDAPPLIEASALERERHRLAQDAACTAGRLPRAIRARDALARLGAADARDPACPNGEPSP